MELRHLRYFVTVAEELHLGRAANHLAIMQPSLSQQIQQLEDELGFPLFRRTKRSVELTDAGSVSAQQVLLQVQKAERAHRSEVGRLVIGYISSSTYDVLPLMLRLFRERFPHVEVIAAVAITSRAAITRLACRPSRKISRCASRAQKFVTTKEPPTWRIVLSTRSPFLAASGDNTCQR
ncbi:LysR family transcriptional regulator [Ktedonobacter racemifer]|uniref:Transcriptional regulator, LysR family n=1 Tax=Ktedonobacter racemifer DSM 44963 TaxID=485913 RepID=D6U192_KTERA|nr:LysR family transcriptional regulator [Ktedonobacter racemifer]EFH82582.1 transcriptional regulator, LysR family [Ktedonobacter racemifer DSM 44963]